MPDPRSIELIHRDLDGEITPEERAELETMLGTQPDAARSREEILEVHRLLAEVPSLEPPAALRAELASELRRIAASPERTELPFETAARRRAAIVRLVFGLAAMLLLVLFIGPIRKAGFDADHARGTMAPSTAPESTRGLEATPDRPRGRIVVTPSGRELSVRPELVDGPVSGRLEVVFDEALLEVASVTGATGRDESTPGRIAVSFDCEVPEIRLVRRAPAPVSLSLELRIRESEPLSTRVELPALTNFSESKL
jgi:hypothetical protein